MTSVLVSSPYVNPGKSLRQLMINVIIGLIPGTAAYVWFFGAGVIVNIILAVLLAIGFEAAILKIRHKPVKPAMNDFSAIVAGWLFALCLPMHSPWWLIAVGIGFTMIAGKHLYGGLGFNPFNPAMVGYVVLLISFPVEMTTWYPIDSSLTPAAGLLDSLAYSFGLADVATWDALSTATPLDQTRTNLGLDLPFNDFRYSPIFGQFGGAGWEWIALAWFIGGIWLLWSKTIMWFIPAALLLSSALFYSLHYLIDPSTTANPVFHLLSGGIIIGAFFIATDPVTASTTNKGRLIYGCLIGFMVYVIRTWGGYPDGVAFAVLLANMCVPLIDYYTQPRVYGEP